MTKLKAKTASALQFTKGEKPIAIDLKDALTPAENSINWVHIQATNTRKELKTIDNLPMPVELMLGAGETRPRSEWLAEGLLINLRTQNMNKDAEPEDLVSLRVWATQNCIITTHRRGVKFLKDWIRHSDTLDFSSTMDVLNAILNEIQNQMTDLTCTLDDQIDELEDSPNSIRENRKCLSNIRRQIILIRRYLMPQREALLRLPTDKMLFLNDANKQRLREFADSTIRILEDLDAERERTTVLQEDLINRLQEDINRKMYLLAIVTLIFMPLAFITGLLGINVGGIPGSTHTSGFWIVCGILLCVMAVEALILKRLKWI